MHFENQMINVANYLVTVCRINVNGHKMTGNNTDKYAWKRDQPEIWQLF